VKWNAGHSKYKFDENALGNYRVMNNALVSNDMGGEDIDEIEDKPNMYSIMQ
jgi:hypothetical protein